MKEYNFSNGTKLICKDGAYDLVLSPEITLADCKAQVAVDSAPPRSLALEMLEAADSADKVCLAGECDCGSAKLTISAERRGLRFEMTLNLNEKKRRVVLFPIAGTNVERATHVLSHGRTMGGCRTTLLPAEPIPGEDGLPMAPDFSSHFQTVISCGAKKLHITQPLRQNFIASVGGEMNGYTVKDLRAQTTFEFPEPGELAAETTTFEVVDDALGAMIKWGDAHATAKTPLPAQACGWNSWDYYRWTISEEEVLKNAEFIAKDPILSKHVKRIIVDDGWQYCYGEWEANPLFPHGMEWLAKRLREMGFIPGLWIAPTVVEPHARIAEWNSEMLARSEGGTPCLAWECMRRNAFILDPTRDDSKRWLREIFAKYAAAGFGYFKLDFLGSTRKAPRFEKNVPRGRIMNEIIEPIREGIAGRAELLGCNYSFDGGTELVEMTRVGSDIHSTWRNARSNAVSVAARFWASNRLWVTDPDFAVCRGPETSKDPDLGRLQCLHVYCKPETAVDEALPGLPYNFGFDNIKAKEAEVLLSLSIINGGVINLSDKLYVLNDRGLDLVRRTVSAARGLAPLPLDLFESNIATKWLQPLRDEKGWRALLINWEDVDETITLDLGAHGIEAKKARNFWNDEIVPISGNIIEATLPPHSCLLCEG